MMDKFKSILIILSVFFILAVCLFDNDTATKSSRTRTTIDTEYLTVTANNRFFNELFVIKFKAINKWSKEMEDIIDRWF